MPKLHFTQPEFAAQSCDLPEGKTTVGRGPRNGLVINDPSVSADHCELLVSWNEVIVRDHGSSNGTRVGGVRVKGQRPLNHGDVIRFGLVEARLELAGISAEADDATAVTANFAAARAVQARPDPRPAPVVVQSTPPTPEHTDATTAVPDSAQPAPPTVAAASQPGLARPIPPQARPNRWLRVVLLVVGAAVLVGLVLRAFR